MANLADIPDKLLNHWKLNEFVLWLNALPITREERNHLASIWSDFTKRKLSALDWASIK
jgi:hypothetical protein